jgi:hypothetical protein
MTWLGNGLKAFRGWRQTLGLLSAEPVPGESAFIRALAQRTGELIDDHNLDVESNGTTITITGRGPLAGTTSILLPVFILRLPSPLDARLELALRSHGNRLQHLLSRIHGRQWPTESAKTHVAVNAEFVSLWWGGAEEADAAASIRPISRGEIGI